MIYLLIALLLFIIWFGFHCDGEIKDRDKIIEKQHALIEGLKNGNNLYCDMLERNHEMIRKSQNQSIFILDKYKQLETEFIDYIDQHLNEELENNNG